MDMYVSAIKQHPGPQQVTRRVKVKVPGKHFPNLQAAEQAQSYWGEAVEHKERHGSRGHGRTQTGVVTLLANLAIYRRDAGLINNQTTARAQK